ncbi:MAG TPA: peptidylprolyl isomerase [Casimicrobiaceae bacterium]|nr:peptidylprolyl isomerase [Casimicrobiaceae bacterium]
MQIQARHFTLIVAAASVLGFGHAAAQGASASDPVLIENAVAAVRKSDYDLELERLPADIRPGFANSERRVNDLLRRMLLDRTLAAQARAEKLDEAPENARRLKAEIDRMYTMMKLAQIEQAAAAEFDAKRAAYEARARELYTVDRKRFMTPEQFNASHILFSTKTRSREEALQLAQDARAKVVAGADFNTLAREISEDSSARRNHGRLDWFTPEQMDPAFSAGVGALKQGEVSQPVLSSFGWHVIRLEGRRPAAQRSFDEVKDEMLNELRQNYVNSQRDAAMAKLRNDSSVKPNPTAIDALVIRVDPEALRRAQELAPKSPASK